MKRKRVFALSAVSLLLILSFMSSIQVQAAQQHQTSIINERIDEFKHQLPSIEKDQRSIFKIMKNLMGNFKENQKIQEMKDFIGSDFKINDFSHLASNFTSFDLIGMLFGSLLFLLLTQPIFLQFIVETQYQFLFAVILVSLLLIEVFQKFFALKVVGIWDPYVKDDIDGIWNFFSIVFFSTYVKIYLSYLPTFIIQYSNVFTQVFFYALMFAIPILFNVCIADSIDMIDWNGDEWPVPLILS